MQKGSFEVDHHALSRGIYVSRYDRLSDTATITFDLRLTKPYAEPVLTQTQLHTYEHCMATAVRQLLIGREIMPVYVGPMGCATGFYIVLQIKEDDFSSKDEAIRECIAAMSQANEDVIAMKEVPGNSEAECGNCYTLGGAQTAREVAETAKAIFTAAAARVYAPDEYEYL